MHKIGNVLQTFDDAKTTVGMFNEERGKEEKGKRRKERKKERKRERKKENGKKKKKKSHSQNKKQTTLSQ